MNPNRSGAIFSNLTTDELYAHILKGGFARETRSKALAFDTGKYTGRLPLAKYIVDEPSCHTQINWNETNRPFSPEAFKRLKNRVLMHLMAKSVYVQDCELGADPQFKLPLTLLTENPIYALFSKTMFLPRKGDKSPGLFPEFTILHAPSMPAIPTRDETAIDAFVIIHFSERLILIGGTGYAGEIKKSAFTVMNYLLPSHEILPMHCSANYGHHENDAAIFFGLSGTGKTTLSADPSRHLVGDDEHGWSPRGLFNFEGGCYAKVNRLSASLEPDIYAATHRYGALLENVAINDAQEPDFEDDSRTENSRAAYPIDHIPHMTKTGLCGHPRNIIMLTCDAFGVFPPVSKLNRSQALYHFLAGYTSKIAGTESGIKEPQATFSPCFGGPFMPRSPLTYAHLLDKLIIQHQPDLWLVNTGWQGGPYGIGQRISLANTRTIIQAILSGELSQSHFDVSVYQLLVPTECRQVASEMLNAKRMWKSTADYDARTRMLAAMFHKQMKALNLPISEEVLSAGPQNV